MSPRCCGMWSAPRRCVPGSTSWPSHDLRRTCARLCHLAGGELGQIQFLLGHVSIQTTDWESNLMPLDLHRIQGGCFNPPWATYRESSRDPSSGEPAIGARRLISELRVYVAGTSSSDVTRSRPASEFLKEVDPQPLAPGQ